MEKESRSHKSLVTICSFANMSISQAYTVTRYRNSNDSTPNLYIFSHKLCTLYCVEKSSHKAVRNETAAFTDNKKNDFGPGKVWQCSCL